MRSTDIQMAAVRQTFDGTEIADVYAEAAAQIRQSGVRFLRGARIAVAVGSRGIASLDRAVRATVDAIRAQGAQPFIIPAMGSHGGATPEGQRAVLRAYGVDEASMACPVVSSLDVVTIDGGSAPRVYLSRDAFEADGIVVVNRVKPHTDFHGPVESGLMKMLVIGLGKHAQAMEMHRYGVPGLRDMIPCVARRVLGTGKVLMGVGIVENAYDRVFCVRACSGAAIPETDAALLAVARRNMASLPVDALDLLIVDTIGKDISGSGMDTNVIGRIRILGETEPERPKIRMIVADGLSASSHGNAIGLGLADVITERLRDAIDWPATTENTVTSGFLERGRMPIVAKNAAQAVDWALRALGPIPHESLRAARIRSTLHLETLWVTPAVLGDLPETAVQVEGPRDIFDKNGLLTV